MSQFPFDVAGSQQFVEHIGDCIDHSSAFRRLACKQANLLTNGCGDFFVREPWKIIERERDCVSFLQLEFQGDPISLGREAIVDW